MRVRLDGREDLRIRLPGYSEVGPFRSLENWRLQLLRRRSTCFMRCVELFIPRSAVATESTGILGSEVDGELTIVGGRSDNEKEEDRSGPVAELAGESETEVE